MNNGQLSLVGPIAPIIIGAIIGGMVCSMPMAFAEEPAYMRTQGVFAVCLAEQMKTSGARPDTIENVFRAKCGQLIEQEHREYTDFVKEQIGRTLTPETAMFIIFREFINPEILLEKSAEIYRSVMSNHK